MVQYKHIFLKNLLNYTNYCLLFIFRYLSQKYMNIQNNVHKKKSQFIYPFLATLDKNYVSAAPQNSRVMTFGLC